MNKVKTEDSFDLANKIAELSLTKKAEDVVILDLRGLTSMTDYFVICSASTDKQVLAIAGAISEGLIKEKIKPWHKEGMIKGTWVLMDFVDVVTHIFHNETREYYDLEELWGDASVTKITDEELDN